MKILKSWLKDYVDFNLSDQELSDKLTFSGTLVEEEIPSISENIVVAKITNIKAHPNADRLRIATVNIGEEALEIVCGAPNIEVGQTVPLAKIGAKLPEFEIKEATIRGVTSEGMLCSEKELGLGENHEGIMILSPKYKAGEPLNRILDSDTVFDLEITPNRGDCLSHIGVARELGALLNKEIKEPSFKIEKRPKLELPIEIESKENCYRYCGAKIKGVKIGPSPSWLQDRLMKLGAKPINNIVDITNYILLDFGQPLHAFDADKVKNGIIARNARDGEDLTTLDGETRTLSSDILVIADSNGPIAIAGVMGGANSEIDDTTRDIILEAAEFNPVNVRKTAKKLKMSTDASYRFERGVDPEQVEKALDKAISMVLEIADGEYAGKKTVITNKYENNWIDIETEKINKLIGISLSEEKIINILAKLGFAIKDTRCQAPSWRHDVKLWQDLAEEISRIYGFGNIPLVDIPVTTLPKKSQYYTKEYIKDLLCENGFNEVYTYSFLSSGDLKSLNIDSSDLLEVANPIQMENKYMRKSLKPGLLRAVSKNPIFDTIAVFEIANVFTKDSEDNHLAFATAGKNAEKTIRKAVSLLAEKLQIDTDKLPVEELSREELQRFKIKKPVTYIVEINLSSMLSKIKINNNEIKLRKLDKKIIYRPVSKYPSITRDVAFIVDNNIESDKVIETIYAQSEIINRVELFDEFSSDKFGANNKNIAFHLDLQHQDRTLKDEEADKIIKKVISSIEKDFKGKVRDY